MAEGGPEEKGAKPKVPLKTEDSEDSDSKFQLPPPQGSAEERLAKVYQQLERLTSEYHALAASQSQSQGRPIIVEATPAQPRLRVFSGLPPAGGNEVGYGDWAAQAEQVLKERNAKERLLSSLKGLALERVEDCSDAAAIFTKVQKTFGEVRPADDLYLKFCENRLRQGEEASDFFLRLWSELTSINKTIRFDTSVFNQKLYFVFARALDCSSKLLALEVRNLFGMPGEALPEPGEVLRGIRQLESSRTKTARSNALFAEEAPPPKVPDLSMSDADVERVALRVAELLRPQPARRRPRSEIDCHVCGQFGHYTNECDTPSHAFRGAATGGAGGRGGHQGGRGNGAGHPQRGSRVPNQQSHASLHRR